MSRVFLLAVLAFVFLAYCQADSRSIRNTFFNAVNKERERLGLKTLTPSSALNANAQKWAKHLLDTNQLTYDTNQYVNGKWMWQVVGRQSGPPLTGKGIAELFLGGTTRPFVLRTDVSTMGLGMASNGKNSFHKYAAEFQ